MDETSRNQDAGTFVIIGETNLARRVCASLKNDGHSVQHLTSPRDDELRTALADGPKGVAVLLHDDVAALRYALAVAHLSPRVPMEATIFDRTVADELIRLLPQCDVTSPADLVTPTLAGQCMDPELVSLHTTGHQARAVRMTDGRLRTESWTARRRLRWQTRLGRITGQLRPHDKGTRIMLTGLLGMVAVLLGDTTWLTLHGHPPAQAFFDAARVIATVGPATAPSSSSGYYVVSAAAMLGTVVLSAIFTAGIVERLLGPKLVGLIGPRTLPRFGHVIIVGMGQVGLRLCSELQRLGVPVVGVERNPHAPPGPACPVTRHPGADRAWRRPGCARTAAYTTCQSPGSCRLG
ncbi:portal protein [Streptomyces sp. NPDC005962]|uniref:portal protein n=1 Tax=Streptomyces sp. NPDC005962 TaxID=3154466 RepID=UPI0033E08E44